MRRLATLIGGALLVAFGAADQAHAQLLIRSSVLSAEPCHPAVCSDFRDGRCQALRMRVAASEEIGKG